MLQLLHLFLHVPPLPYASRVTHPMKTSTFPPPPPSHFEQSSTKGFLRLLLFSFPLHHPENKHSVLLKLQRLCDTVV